MGSKLLLSSEHYSEEKVGMACFESFVSSPASSTKASQFEGAGASVEAISLVHSHSVKSLLA